MTELQRVGNHSFWPDSIRLADPAIFNLRLAGNSKSITDIDLLGLAKSNNGKLATFDRRINVEAVIGGAEALHIIES